MKMFKLNLFKKLEQNDQKCVNFFSLANICKGGKYDHRKGGGKNMIFNVIYIYIDPCMVPWKFYRHHSWPQKSCL